jgi:hypothetical protein
LEEPSEKGAWVGTVTARRRNYEEREKRSGANLEENSGYLEIMTDVRLKLTGRLDRTVEATNANIAEHQRRSGASRCRMGQVQS